LEQLKSSALQGDIKINKEWCKGCGVCMAFCPREALFLDKYGKAEKDSNKCNFCGVCETYCPDFAIAVVKRRLPVDAGNKTGFDARQ